MLPVCYAAKWRIRCRYDEDTINESDFASLARELQAIWRNLKLVCNPLIRQDEVNAMLQHWDLWGPLVRPVCIPLAVQLLAPSSQAGWAAVSAPCIYGCRPLQWL